MKEIEIVDIPKKMEKFFGCSGKMLKPSTSFVEAIVNKVPKAKLITLEQLREKLASDFNVQTTCPSRSLSENRSRSEK